MLCITVIYFCFAPMLSFKIAPATVERE